MNPVKNESIYTSIYERTHRDELEFSLQQPIVVWNW